MNKSVVLCAGLCVALAFTSCKSQESAYKKAYLKAQANSEQPTQPAQEETPVVAPIETKTATETTVVDNMDNVSVRSEDFTVVSGPGVKNFSVVVGSFSLKANAEGLQRTLNDAGRTAQIVYNSARVSIVWLLPPSTLRLTLLLLATSFADSIPTHGFCTRSKCLSFACLRHAFSKQADGR